MQKTSLCMCVVAGSLLAVAYPASSQQIVHALTGTVSSIDSASKTITLFQDSGSSETYGVLSAKTRLAFDKRIEADATEAKTFETNGAYVILFYFGTDQSRTAVAVKSLGQGPFSTTTGEVTNWNGHQNTISVKGDDGKVQSFKVDDQTVAETYTGVVNGSKFDAGKGDQVRIVSTLRDGRPMVLFIREK